MTNPFTTRHPQADATESLNMARLRRRSAAFGRRIALCAALLLGVSGCMGPTTSVRLPSCTESIEVEGQHQRRGDLTLTFDHGWDLPGSQTRVVIEHADGTAEERTYTNLMPDFMHLVGGVAAGFCGSVLLAVYATDLSRGMEPLEAPSLWAAPVGGGLLLVGTGLLLTGWNPGGPIRPRGRCGE